MRTTVTLDSALVEELLKHTHGKTKTAAVTEAVREQVRRIKLDKLAELRGKINFQTDSLAAGERANGERAGFLKGLMDADQDAD